jgi:hypothetical protein
MRCFNSCNSKVYAMLVDVGTMVLEQINLVGRGVRNIHGVSFP